MLGSPAGPGGGPQRGGLWPLAQAATAPSATSFSADGISKYGVYSLFPGAPAFGSALYSHASTMGRFASGQIQQTGNTFHAAHKVSDSLFSATGYTFGTSTTPPGAPYSPISVAQLELLKGYSNNIIIQQSQDFAMPRKLQITDRRCDEKCCSMAKSSLPKTCPCPLSPLKKIQEISPHGCSRTNPIEWTGVNVKKEPGIPCQVAEITTSVSPVIKVEVASPTQKTDNTIHTGGGSVISSTGAQIPIGIAVARQRVQHDLMSSPSLPPGGLLTTVNTSGGGAQIKEIDGTVAAAAAGMAATGGASGAALLQCSDDRSNGMAAGWQVGGAHGPTLTAPTLWQYPAPVPMEPMVPLPLSTVPPMGLELVRDPTTGGLLLLPTTTGIAPLQQTVVWPSYHQASSVLLPSVQPPPLQLLSSATSDYLSSSTTLHQHTQTHSTRLVAVTTDTKRKIPLPLPTTLIKIETDGLDQTKTLQAVSTIANNTGTVFTDQGVSPLVTTHVIYQHPTTNLIVSQTPVLTTETTSCRSQGTSPVVAVLSPTRETLVIQEEEQPVNASVDASNQTDTPICSEDDNTSHAISDVIGEEKMTEAVVLDIEPPKIEEVTSSVDQSATETFPAEAIKGTSKPDLSGLELLSNSIEEFERVKQPSSDTAMESVTSPEMSTTEPTSPTDMSIPVNDNLGGLDLLCALAEQRILEENIDQTKSKRDKSKEKNRRREKRKSKKHHSDEPKKKKAKHHSTDREHRKKEKRHTSTDRDYHKSKSECLCQYKNYKTPESEQEVKKFLESKAKPHCCQGDWPCMNAMELKMRIKLAELQREYREKQIELSKLKPKQHHSDSSKKKSRKKSTHSERSTTPPPSLKTLQPADSTELLKSAKLELVKRRHSEVETPVSASKKRKVGRPKRLMSTGEVVGTETIVTKKLKSNFVGCLLAAKEKLKQLSNDQEYPDSTPPRYIEETYTHKLKRVKNNNNNIVDDIKSSKARPQLKAEATVKVDNDDEWHSDDHIEEEIVNTSSELIIEPVKVVEEVQNPCTLNESHLEENKLRVLRMEGGLFYAGQLNALQPPDIYSITLDGERGNRAHIMSREEILRDAIVEVAPKTTDDIPVGTRLCAYWSQQYRCLYPGSAADPGSPDPQLDGKFVSVEFDDGDSGRIALQDIRLLPSQYPIMEYDPNPLLSLSKRKRRASTSISTEEKHYLEVPKPLATPCDHSTSGLESFEEKKKKKKQKRKDKGLKSDDKKKKKKHRCADEQCKHKKHHKKHKKHRKHHDKSRIDDDDDDDETLPKRAFYCQIIDEKEIQDEGKENVIVKQEVTPPEVTEESSQQSIDEYPNYEAPGNPVDEVTRDEILEATENKKSRTVRDRQESVESRSKMSAFLPARQMWHWSGTSVKTARAKGKCKKLFYKGVRRGKDIIQVGDSAVFLSTGRPDRPYIGKIESMWQSSRKMVVRVKWFYHPEETYRCETNLKYAGGLFESAHCDENDVQTISHKCDVVRFPDFLHRMQLDPEKYALIYDDNDTYYLAGFFDTTLGTIRMEPGIPTTKTEI